MLFRLSTSLVALLALSACSTSSLLPGGGDEPTPVAVPSDDARPAPAGNTTPPTEGVIDTIPAAARDEYQRAVFLLETGDQAGAKAEFERFVGRYSEYPQPYVNLAIIDIAEGRIEEARQSLDTALRIRADFAPALNQLGILHRKNGDFAEAEAAYMKAITVNPNYALAHLNLGILNDLYLGRLGQALSAYQSYQALTVEEDPQVARWIADLTRRTSQ